MHNLPALIITRPLEDAKATAELLTSGGIDCFIEPVMHIEYMSQPFNSGDGIIITSRNALRTLNIIDHKECRLIIVGKSTCNLAKETGFINYEYAGKNLKDLCHYIKLNYKDKHLIYLSGEIITGELTYENCYAYINRIIVYKTIPKDKLSESFKENILKNNFSGVIILSRESGKIFYKLLENEELQRYTKGLYAFCLSSEIAESISGYGFKATIYPKKPYMSELIKTVINFQF